MIEIREFQQWGDSELIDVSYTLAIRIFLCILFISLFI